MFIEVLYADLTRQRVPVEDVGILCKTEVLAIILSCVDDVRPRLNGCRRVAEATGKDFYYIVIQDDFIGLDSRDEYDRIQFYQRPKPFAGNILEHPKYDGEMYIFEGKGIPDEQWKKALELFNREIH
jgi:hypothetical protein